MNVLKVAAADDGDAADAISAEPAQDGPVLLDRRRFPMRLPAVARRGVVDVEDEGVRSIVRCVL